MDGQRFDTWTKALTAGIGSRRTALRLLARGTLVGLLARLGQQEASARRVPAGERCRKSNGRNIGDCTDGAKCNSTGYCKCKRGLRNCHGQCCNPLAGEVCSLNGCCNTLAGAKLCNGRCTDTDPNNCGECGHACGRGEVCGGGLCRSPRCPRPNWYVCGATCCWAGEGGPYVCCPETPFCCNPGLQCHNGGCCDPRIPGQCG